MFSYCSLDAEVSLQEISCDSNTLCTPLSNNSTYYEENPVYSEISEPPTESCKSTKTKHSISPVEIHQESILNIDLPPISWHNYECVPKILNLINTGRTILINGQWTKSRPYITGGPLNGSYIFSQIHFHSPSEHEIDGKRYPLEMHVVHYKTSYLTQERAMEEKDGTVVIVYLFQVLNSNQSALSSISDSIHLIEKANEKIELSDISLNQILQPVVSNYYIYWGSVSTSKNSYLLQWIISCTNLYVNQNEMDKLVKILCSNESFVERRASQMNILNNIIYHAEGYDLPVEEVETSYVTPKYQCRYHCQNCKICEIHKGEYLHFHIIEPASCASKEFDEKCTEIKTSSCEKTSKSSLCDRKQKQKEKKKKAKTTFEFSCLSVDSNSQSFVCEDKKKTKKKKNAHKGSSCSIITDISNCDDLNKPEHNNSAELNACSSSSLKKKADIRIKLHNLKDHDQKTKRKKVKKSETSSCDTLRSNSKTSLRSSKTKNKKKTTKKTLEDKHTTLNKSHKKEKPKSKQSKTERCSESSVDSSKSSENIKYEKKKKTENEAENCDIQVKLQCMPIMVSTDKAKEGLLDMKGNYLEENKEREKMEESKKEIEELPIGFEKLLEPPRGAKAKKTEVSEADDDITTIFEKNRGSNNSETPKNNDYRINFLLAPNNLQSKYSPLTSESECLEVAKSNNLNCNPAVNECMNKFPKFEVSSINSQEQSKDICFETEHLFHYENKKDFLACVIQQYNVAVICNHNVIQEFRGTFHPNELELGACEKLHLVPKYPEPENATVRLNNCFVKKETSDQLCIRVKFLVNKVNINEIRTKEESWIEKERNTPDLEVLDVKNTQTNFAAEKLSRDSETESRINTNQSDKKEKVLENEECTTELLKKPDSDRKQSSKNITVGSVQKSSKLKKEEEKGENNLIEKTDKTIKDLFYKRKKVYFSCEKVEKDENSGKKVFVGSFRTKKELKALSKDKKSAKEDNPLSLAEKSKRIDVKKSSNGKSRDQLVKNENSKARLKQKFQPPAKRSEVVKSDESKNLITLHKHKPKNSQANNNKDERQNVKLSNGETIIQSEISSLEEKNKSEKPEVKPFSVSSQKLSSSNFQIDSATLPTKKDQNLQNIKKIVKKKEEYNNCL